MASIQDLTEQWKKALSIEANELKTQGGTKTIIINGKCLTRNEDGATYWFTYSADLLLPDGTPIRIQYKNLECTGQIVSVEGQDVILKVDSYIGESIREAILFSEPWELLLTLAKRLDRITESPMKQKRVHRLLAANSPIKHPQEKAKNEIHELILRAKYNFTTYVWGPPGTGKTYTLARMIARHYQAGKKILILSHSNAAVDVLVFEAATYIQSKYKWKTGDIVRYGFSSNPKINEHPDLLAAKLVEKNSPELRIEQAQLEESRADLKSTYHHSKGKLLANTEAKLKEVRYKIKKEEEHYVENARVIGATLSKAAMDPVLFEREYDLIVVDEASMAYIPQIAFAASLGKRIIVCGDFKQLPPIAISKHRIVAKWLCRDIFEATKIVENIGLEKAIPNLMTLTKQRRMHPQISRFTNQYIYGNKVSDHAAVATIRQPIANMQPFVNDAAILLDLSQIGAFALKDASSDSRYNLLSACIAMQLILSAKANGLDSIGYITPFKAQSRFVTVLLKEFFPENQEVIGDNKIIAATVHKFQGSERDMIIFDSVDSYPQSRASVLLTDNNSEKLMNVAITRAKGKFIHLADRKYLESRTGKNTTIRKLIDHFVSQGKDYSRQQLPELLKKSYDTRLQWFTEDYEEQIRKDIAQAKKITISISIPNKMNNKLWRAFIHAENNTHITVISSRKEGIPLRKFDHIAMDLVQPFIDIDGQIIWIGLPFIETNFESSPKQPFITCRLEAKKVIQSVYRFIHFPTASSRRVEREQKPISYQPTYSLGKYIRSWDQCPNCNSIRQIQTKQDGSITLACDHCGMPGRITVYFLEKFLTFTDLRCTTCNRPLEAVEDGKQASVTCSHCHVNIPVQTLL
ncbi:AAA domain-containing protein [Caldibacillus lycopersici]|uniref:AAA domain-containing protein n=1 Tax=Perspicuibacillus lycopersici TaxID=1325689 RepID=A0AAE3IUS1_9BACI|nr:AAA domain-containing protein [Perspicuibacillus lycopersici]MCU9614978.1 AAA domain-containing protein [Perspicuibacillus lycopersici]